MNVFGKLNKLKLKKPKRTEINFDSPFELFGKIYANYSNSFLLESMESDTGLARYSFLGFEPIATLKARNNILEIDNEGSKEEIETKNPFNEIKSLINTKNGKKGFSGGLVGYVSYEALKYFEKIKLKPGPSPDFEFGLFLDGIIFDRLRSKCEYITSGPERIDEVNSIVKEDFEVDSIEFKPKSQYVSQEKYEGMVVQAKKKIKSGEIFQTVLSNAVEYKITGDKLAFYEKLRHLNPSPYMYHLKMDEHEIIGSSPEMLVRCENRHIETFPIAGSRIRGKNPAEDKKLEDELLIDKKELAEHLMLVDLARNDVGRVSKFGSVRVPEYMRVKKFSHIQHIVSKVCGKMQEDKNAVDAFASVFPAGTVSGAPKIRAIKIINQLEKHPRGPYAGAVGYFSLNGNADFAITIRSLICQDNHAKIQAGAGIVHDSVPENEYYECQSKAQALVRALEISSKKKVTDAALTMKIE